MDHQAPEPDTARDDRPPSGAAPPYPRAALLRIGDDDRAACATKLADAVATGHLSPAEYDNRLPRALSAVTAAEITDLVYDLPTPAHREPQAPSHPVPVVALKVAIFQFLLVLLAFVLGVDLESELRSAFTISCEIWVVGTLGGAAGYLIAYRSPSVRRGLPRSQQY